MAVKSKYLKRSKLSDAKIRQLVRYFVLDLQAIQITKLVTLNRNTVNRYVTHFRQKIAESCEKEFPFKGGIELDESYFGGKRIKGKRGRGAYKKIPVFVLFKRNGKVYTKVVPDCSRPVLQAIVCDKVSLDDGWRGYNGLVYLCYKKHYCVNHSSNDFSTAESHINGIENFWGIAKVRPSKFEGLNRTTFYLHLKECE
jgi:transposase-like protein